MTNLILKEPVLLPHVQAEESTQIDETDKSLELSQVCVFHVEYPVVLQGLLHEELLGGHINEQVNGVIGPLHH